MKKHCFLVFLLFNRHFLYSSDMIVAEKNNIFNIGPVELVYHIIQQLDNNPTRKSEIKKILEKNTINKMFNERINNQKWYSHLYQKRVIQDIRFICFDDTRIINKKIYQKIYDQNIFQYFYMLENLRCISNKEVTYYYTEEWSDVFKILTIKKQTGNYLVPDETLGMRIINETSGRDNMRFIDTSLIKHPCLLDFFNSSIEHLENVCNDLKEKNIKIDAIRMPNPFLNRYDYKGEWDKTYNFIKNNSETTLFFGYNNISYIADYLNNPCIDFFNSPYFSIDYFLDHNENKILSPQQEKIFIYFIENGLVACIIQAASNNKKLSLLSLLKQYGVNLNQVSSKYKPLLCYAFDNLDLLKKMIELGADCNAQNFKKQTPLNIALEKLEPILNAHVDCQLYTYKNKESHNKICFQIIDILFRNGAKPITNSSESLNITIYRNYGSIFDAVRYDNYWGTLLNLCIDKKINKKNEHKRSLFCYVKSEKILNLLLNAGLIIDTEEINKAIKFLKYKKGIDSRTRRIFLLKELLKKKTKH